MKIDTNAILTRLQASGVNVVEKDLTTADLATGGQLNAKQQDRFIRLVRNYTKLLPMARFKRMTQLQETVDKMHIGEPITVAATEGTAASTATYDPRFNKVTLTATKVRSRHHFSTETIQDNIEQEGFEDSLFAMFAQRMATDFEILAVQGDSTISATDPLSLLLKSMNGWDTLATGAHVVDAGGAKISKDIFLKAMSRLPKQFKANKAELRWLASDLVWQDWMELTSQRQTATGDAALDGTIMGPFGIRGEMIPSIPDDQAITISVATSAVRVGTEFGPFVFTSAAHDFTLELDNQGTDGAGTSAGTGVTIDLAAPDGNAANATALPQVLDAVEVCKRINARMAAVGYTNIQPAKVDPEGRIRINSATTGTSSEVETNPGSSSCLAVLGFADSATNGAAAAAGNSQKLGSFMYLVNPKNLIWGMVDGTRIFSKFDMDSDEMNVVAYTQLAFAIENPDAMVRVANLAHTDYSG